MGEVSLQIGCARVLCVLCEQDSPCARRDTLNLGLFAKAGGGSAGGAGAGGGANPEP